jgi:hypothetical protein
VASDCGASLDRTESFWCNYLPHVACYMSSKENNNLSEKSYKNTKSYFDNNHTIAPQYCYLLFLRNFKFGVGLGVGSPKPSG